MTKIEDYALIGLIPTPHELAGSRSLASLGLAVPEFSRRRNRQRSVSANSTAG